MTGGSIGGTGGDGPGGSGGFGGPGGAGGPDGLAEPSADDDPIGPDDIARLNIMAVERAGAFARLAGAALIVAGVLGVAGWLWVTVRQQQRIDDAGSPFAFEDGGPSLVNRLDALAEYVFFLTWSALALGAGLGLRLAADYATARSGGSLTGFAVGDPVPDGGLSHDPDQIEVDPLA